MALHSPPRDPSETEAILEGQLRESFGRVVYSHKTHEKTADALLGKLGRIRLWQIVLSAITTGGCVAVVFGAGKVGACLAALVSTGLLGLTLYTKDDDLGERAQKHRRTGADLWGVREKYLSLIVDLRIGNQTMEQLQSRRDRLVDELQTIYTGAPSTNARAYREAQEGLQQREEMTFSEDEIDAFLPEELGKLD